MVGGFNPYMTRRNMLIRSDGRQACNDACHELGYKFFAVQYGKECFCDNELNIGDGTYYPLLPDSECERAEYCHQCACHSSRTLCPHEHVHVRDVPKLDVYHPRAH